MKKCVAVFLVLLLCLSGCAVRNASLDGVQEYMGTWHIYIHAGPDGDAIGTVTLSAEDEEMFAVEINDFIGAADITVVKHARVTEQGKAIGIEKVQDGESMLEMHFRFGEDENGKQIIVLDFIAPDTEHRYALESLHLYR